MGRGEEGEIAKPNRLTRPAGREGTARGAGILAADMAVDEESRRVAGGEEVLKLTIGGEWVEGAQPPSDVRLERAKDEGRWRG